MISAGLNLKNPDFHAAAANSPTSVPPPLQIRYVESEQEFFALRDAWNGLAKQTGAHVFLRHEWFSAAWAWIHPDAALFLICVYQDQELIGLCPLVRRRRSQWGMTFRHLEFLTVPDTQCCDILGAAEDAARLIEAIAGALHRSRATWDTCALTNLTAGSLALLLPGALQLNSLTTEASGNPVVRLNGTWEAYYGSRSRRLKKNNNLIANRLKKAGDIEVTRLNHGVDSATLEAWLRAAIRISAKSWKEKTGLSLNHPGPQRFIRALSAAANQNNWLSLWLLKLDGQAIAMEYQLNYGDEIYALRADFDADFMDCSPGAYLNCQLLKGLFASSARNYYMGPGNNAYKLRWTNDKVLLHDLTIYNDSWAGRLAYAIDRYCRPLRRLLLKLFARQSDNS